MRHVVFAVFFAGASSAPALADCSAVASAMLAVEDRGGVRQRMYAAQSDAVIGETLKLPDAMYQRGAAQAPWRRIPLDAAKRRAAAESAMRALPLSDCSGPRAGDDGGLAVRIYDYSQPDPTKPGSKRRGAVWIDAEGLVRRQILQDGSRIVFEYGAFPAPVTGASAN